MIYTCITIIFHTHIHIHCTMYSVYYIPYHINYGIHLYMVISFTTKDSVHAVSYAKGGVNHIVVCTISHTPSLLRHAYLVDVHTHTYIYTAASYSLPLTPPTINSAPTSVVWPRPVSHSLRIITSVLLFARLSLTVSRFHCRPSPFNPTIHCTVITPSPLTHLHLAPLLPRYTSAPLPSLDTYTPVI